MEVTKEQEYPYQNLSLIDMDGEIWKDAPGYEGAYQVSNKGRVKSLARFVHTPQGGRFKDDDSILKQNLRQLKNGTVRMLYVALFSEGTATHIATARLVYSAFIKRLPNFKKKILFILHKDNNSLNNTVENLFSATASEKIKHFIALGVVTPNFHRFSEEGKRNFLTARYQQISQYTLEGKYLKTYCSMSEGARQVGIDLNAIAQNLQGKSRHSGGFQWKRGEDKSDISPVVITPLNKEIMQFSKKGGYIATYSSIREAERLTGVSRSYISKCISGKGHTAGSFIWKEANALEIPI